MAGSLRPLAVVAVAVLCVALGISWVSAQDESGPLDKDDKKLARRQEEAKKQLEHLEEVMQELARKIEEKQPDEAKKLREAWKAAREKLLLEDMEAIYKALLEGKRFEAFKRSDKVVENLLELLNYLIGKQFEKKDPTDELKELKENIKKIDELEQKQKDLQDKTGSISKVKDRIKSIEQAMKEIDQLSQRQSDLMKNPSRQGQDSDSKMMQKLQQASKALEGLMKDQSKLHNTTKEALAKGRRAYNPKARVF